MGYAFTPESVIRDTRLSRDARYLWTLLASYAGKKGTCWPSQAELAQHAAASTRAVRRWLVELEELGYVTTHSGGPHKPCTYALCADPDRTPASAQTGHQRPKEVSQRTISEPRFTKFQAIRAIQRMALTQYAASLPHVVSQDDSANGAMQPALTTARHKAN